MACLCFDLTGIGFGPLVPVAANKERRQYTYTAIAAYESSRYWVARYENDIVFKGGDAHDFLMFPCFIYNFRSWEED